MYLAINISVIPFTIAFGEWAPDWMTISALPTSLASGDLYVVDLTRPVYFAWSPVMAWLMAGVSILGYWPWVFAHFVAVIGLAARLPFLAILVAGSWAFWLDAAMGNTMTFVVVAAGFAIAGSRNGALCYIALCLLMPRPVQLPLFVWLVWRDRSLVRPTLHLLVAHAALVLASGHAVTWLTTMVEYGGSVEISLGPTRYVGLIWLVIGIPLGVWLAIRGRVGWAGLAITPYLLGQYLMMPLVELARSDKRGAQEPPALRRTT